MGVCLGPSTRLDVTCCIADSTGFWVLEAPSCGWLSVLMACGASGTNCISGWFGVWGFVTLIPASCNLFCTAAAMFFPRFSNQSVFTLRPTCAWVDSYQLYLVEPLQQLGEQLNGSGEDYFPPHVSCWPLWLHS